ncbi:hypothetical protein SEUCBS140593_003039 [Sporothrix eucalyptigena]|uniref:Dihydroxyacetone kinase n=1 Tax=Sporothrix eucalyptigena TaxID=1812306 RepID=A0ABP0BCM7_9PEZI
MSSKHYFPETAANELVPAALRALVTATPHLHLLPADRVVLNATHQPGTVAIISGGGSGHEPGWSGYVGNGLLAGAACGDIFASPSMKQVLAAIRGVPGAEISKAGTILMITNYTGDRLHFGLAAERAKALGISGGRVEVLPATDDVSIPRSRIRVGRRGMPGHVLTLKCTGAASAEGRDFDACVRIAKAVNNQLVTIGSALDHCHVPGRQNHESIGADVCVVGAGIHNEPGAEQLSPFPSVPDLIKHLLNRLCDPTDTDRAFVDFSDSTDEVVLLINNYGGMSNLELGALTDEVIQQLKSTWNIVPVRIFCGVFETSLNGPGFSVSLANFGKAAKEAGLAGGVEELLTLLDAPTTAPAWPKTAAYAGAKASFDDSFLAAAENLSRTIPESEDIVVSPTLLDSVIRTACTTAIAAEPRLTEWDMVMGDGDCGTAVEAVSQAILGLLDNKKVAAQGSVLQLLFAVIDAVDDMGGTLGAIFGILLSALANQLQTLRASYKSDDPALYATALLSAVESLKDYTPAREGDRTVMDVLIPFAEAFAKTPTDFAGAVATAHSKAEATRQLKPKLGRATYVGTDAALPDPGAYALYEMLQGMLNALGKQ